MRTKVIIENGETNIILTPENDFERDIIEKMVDRKKDFHIHTTANTEWMYGSHSKHIITMNIKETR